MDDVHLTLIGIGIQTIMYLLGGYALVLRNDWSNQALKEEMRNMQQEVKKLAEVVTIQAVQTARLDHLFSQVASIERRVEDLRRGNGYIQNRNSVDGEYP